MMHPIERAILYSESAFETMAVHNGVIPLWHLHKKRLELACSIFQFQLDFQLLESEIKSSIHNLNSNVCKLVIYRTAGGTFKPQYATAEFLISIEEKRPNNPIQWLVSDIGTKFPSPLDSIKSNCYTYVQAALNRKSDISLILSPQERVLEWEYGCVFWKSNNQWFTIPPNSGQIQSVFLDAFLTNAIEVPELTNLQFNAIQYSEFLNADSYALGNAVRGFTRIEIQK